MKTRILSYLMVCMVFISLSSCLDDDEPKKDVTNEISMTISSETGMMYPWGSEVPIECMLMKSDDNPDRWKQLAMGEIKGFTYQKGHEYELRVLRTILGNPPMDGSDCTYSLVSILQDRLITEPEEPEGKEINSEEDIIYHDKCPFNKYAMEKELLVDSEGNIRSNNGHLLPSYEKAKFGIETVLPKDDPNWIEFNKVPYMAIYAFVLSPFTDEIRLVRNKPVMFKEAIPTNEFNNILSMESGEKVHYALILVNVHMDGLQKLEFTITKQ